MPLFNISGTVRLKERGIEHKTCATYSFTVLVRNIRTEKNEAGYFGDARAG